MTSDLKGQGHFIFLFFYGSGNFVDWFGKVTKSMNSVLMWFRMFNLNFGHDLDLWPWRSCHQWSTWLHKYVIGKTLVSLPGAQKCPNLDFNKLRSKVTMTSEVKDPGHFVCLFCCGSGNFVDCFWKVTKSMNSVLMWFRMFNLNSGHDLDLCSDFGGHVTNEVSNSINMG